MNLFSLVLLLVLGLFWIGLVAFAVWLIVGNGRLSREENLILEKMRALQYQNDGEQQEGEGHRNEGAIKETKSLREKNVEPGLIEPGCEFNPARSVVVGVLPQVLKNSIGLPIKDGLSRPQLANAGDELSGPLFHCGASSHER